MQGGQEDTLLLLQNLCFLHHCLGAVFERLQRELCDLARSLACPTVCMRASIYAHGLVSSWVHQMTLCPRCEATISVSTIACAQHQTQTRLCLHAHPSAALCTDHLA